MLLPRPTQAQLKFGRNTRTSLIARERQSQPRRKTNQDQVQKLVAKSEKRRGSLTTGDPTRTEIVLSHLLLKMRIKEESLSPKPQEKGKQQPSPPTGGMAVAPAEAKKPGCPKVSRCSKTQTYL
eukprot:GHVL01042413.1.p1 GENE.GHVL01042413.1~~GHVL01042413.1.p1  ORF type:complete len:124 (-),score=7.64 GHVL01042413.1:1727-2098(-)